MITHRLLNITSAKARRKDDEQKCDFPCNAIFPKPIYICLLNFYAELHQKCIYALKNLMGRGTSKKSEFGREDPQLGYI